MQHTACCPPKLKEKVCFCKKSKGLCKWYTKEMKKGKEPINLLALMTRNSVDDHTAFVTSTLLAIYPDITRWDISSH